jgi:hypothetical protein
MATTKSVSNKCGRRSPEIPNGAVPSSQLTTVWSERRTLISAGAVLRCVAVALEYDDLNSDGSDYAEAIEVARNLILQSIERLESRARPDTLTAKA